MRSDLMQIAREVNEALRARGLTMATAESCTGGTIASAVTSVPGSSDVFKGGVVAYSNDIKSRVLGVSEDVLQEFGAVSEPVVVAMAKGVCRLMQCDCAVATSGVAGPGGGTPQKPVGTVWVAVAVKGNVSTTLLQQQDAGRENNICVSAKETLALLLNSLQKNTPCR